MFESGIFLYYTWERKCFAGARSINWWICSKCAQFLHEDEIKMLITSLLILFVVKGEKLAETIY